MQHDAKALIESLNTAVLLTDGQLRIVFANSAAQQLFLLSRSRLLQMKLTDLIDKEQKNLLDSVQAALKPYATGFSASKAQFIPEPNRCVTADLNISHYAGKGKGLVVECRPVDYQQKINDEVQRRTQHLAARDLVRNLAHEIKNPLGGIRGAAQLVDMTYGSDKALHEYTRVIIEQADRLKALVDNLLGPQRPNPLTLGNVHYVIEKVLSLEAMETHGNVRFKKDYDPSLPELPLDVNAMEQALINIVSNAVQALTENKTHNPTIEVRTRARSGSWINGVKHPTSLVIVIADNGPGIPENIRETVFYPMVTSRTAGNGLGLSIAQSIVERHQGTIECESEPGRTVFKIILPYLKEKSMKK